MLEVKDVCLSFEGLKAVNHVSLSAADGQITALIGPNGAGKTTLFNLIAGVYKPDSGQVFVDGQDITGLKPHQICAYGITRTYQVIKLFQGMSVIENVLVGMHTIIDSGFGKDIIKSRKTRKQEQQAYEEALRLIEFVGLKEYAKFPAGALAYGQQRLLEIARAMASRPKFLLLDEPAAGMNSKEKNDLSDIIRKIVSQGISVLIVEHDMSLVMSIAEKIYVINSGKNLSEGTPEEVAHDPKVIEAYLGSEVAD